MYQLKHKVSLQIGNYLSVTPIYMGKGSKYDAGKYRPICLIGHIMKIFEKEIQLQVMGYLEVNNRISSLLTGINTIHKIIYIEL